MRTIRVGFIGCGTHSGRRLYPSLRSAGLELVALCDMDRAKAEARAAEYGVASVYTDYRAMCEGERLDAVLVAIGPEAHYELALALLERGYHVWTEKPCAPDAEQADRVVEAAERAGRHVQTGFNYRYTHGVQKALGLIRDGRFAPPAMLSVRWWLGVPDPIEFWYHYMVHAVDLLNYLAPGGLRDMRVAHQGQAGYDFYVATFRADDCLAVLELSSHMPIDGHWARIDWQSRDGQLSVRDFTELTHFATVPWGKFAPPDAPDYDGDRVWRTEPLIARGPFVDSWGYVTELDKFRQAVLGLAAPECTIREAAWGMRVCEQMLAARPAG